MVFDPEICSILVIAANVFRPQPLEMPFVENDGMIQDFPPGVANEAFSDSILPWTTKARPLRHDAEALDRLDNIGVELSAAIQD